jgi:hypothetical protein
MKREIVRGGQGPGWWLVSVAPSQLALVVTGPTGDFRSPGHLSGSIRATTITFSNWSSTLSARRKGKGGEAGRGRGGLSVRPVGAFRKFLAIARGCPIDHTTFSFSNSVTLMV